MTNIIGSPTLDDALLMLAKAVEENEARGERTLVFCEDRLTLRAEHAVLSVRGGTFLTEVSTFRRFLSRSEGEKRQTVSKQGSVLEIAALLSAHQDKLGCFKKNAAQAVYETIAQLSASCVTEELLERSAEETEGMLRRKLGDLALLLGEYHAFLRGHGLLDENGYLALLPDMIAEELTDTNVIFFAFPSFTRQAQDCIRAAVLNARSCTGIFLSGHTEFHTNEAARVFRKTAEELGEVHPVQTGTTLAGDALALYSALFSTDRPKSRIRTENIRIFAPKDETAEMNEIAARIKKYASEGRRYRDVAVLVGGEEYFLAARKAFEAYRIPYYADVKRKFSEHPFCALVLAVLAAVADGILPGEADDIASSVYFGDGGNYRNYLLRYGAYRGGARREIKEGAEINSYGERQTLVRCREKLLAMVDCFKGKKTGSGYVAGIRALRQLVDEERVTARLADALPAEERAFLDVSPLEGVLTETEKIVGGESFTPREFINLLKSGLEALTVSILPQYADAVFIGDLTESRILRADILFCAGLTDALPRVSQDTAVITDDEIRLLTRLQVEIDPAIAVVNARAREALALNLCAFNETLYLSCPARKGGKEAARSEIFYFVERTFDTAPMSEVYPYDFSAYTPAMLAFYRDLDALVSEKSPARAEALIARYSSAREVLKAPALEEWIPTDPEALRATREKAAVHEAGELWLKREVSPTLLEEYFSCPYLGFVRKALRLSEGEERTLLDSADAGSFVHTVLECVAKNFNELATEEDCRAAAQKTATELLKNPHYAAIADTAAGTYTGSRLVEEAAEVTVVAYRQLAQSAFHMRAAESEIRLPDLKLKGKTDRVDEAGEQVRIIDYKTGHIDDSPAAYYTGRKLQLQLYLRASSEGGVPAGAFYFPAADDFVKEDTEGKFRMKGFFCKEPEVMANLDTTRAEGEKSAHFESGSKDKGMNREDFEDFLDYSLLVSGQAEREMRAGNITPSPYEGVCRYCKYKGMCGFDGEPRKEGTMKCAEIVKIARAAKEEEA